ncbi:probable disease resistance protein At1g12280 [Durio zibethinus]|uniref:Probable disease resistance protein At1g12280 n=1 Tax=Durio zibethinus TaxID=66656 RepID=A0A6P5WQW1_DURZI|nr:probable disease resistance protein At1g12280 [Durio zibethinus]
MRDCRKIWQDQLNMDSFSKLKNILVKDCETLLNIFPFSMMEKLEELDMLEIVNCNSLEEIIEPRGLIANESNAVTATESIVVEAVTKFVFPRVTYLRLDELPKLKSFYSRMHATDWPSLKRMKLVSCHKVELFASECLGFGETQAESQLGEISNKQPLFWVNEDTFPVLEELTWKRNDKMKGIWHGQLSLQCFRKLKVLNLECFPDTSATALPYWFLRSLPYLEKIVINEASFCQIFQFEGISDEERHTSALTQIKELRLSKLPELTHLWKEEFNPRATLCKIRILEVLECGQLKTLVPSSVSFENLTTLEVSRCHGFINLIACSTAKSLMLLERMSITDCKMIEEIIACEGEEIKGGIMFTKLKYLRLSCLPSLASFCLGDHIIEFPALRKVIVRECPKMKIFCEGVLSTPKLQQVQLTEDEDEVKVRWEGDLKTTVKQLFEEMNVQNSEVIEVTL